MSEEVKADAAQDTPKADAAPAADKAPEAQVAEKLFDADKPKEEAKPAAEVKKDEPKKDDAQKPAEDKKVVPEKYDLKLPEDSILDSRAVERIAAIAKQQGLSNEEAQDLLDRQNVEVAEFTKAQSKQWLDDVKNDKELGGDGLNKNVEMAHRVLNRFGSDSLKKELDRTGYGNHPELVRLLVKIGKSMSEDQFVMAGTQPAGKKAIEDVFYPTHNKE